MKTEEAKFTINAFLIESLFESKKEEKCLILFVVMDRDGKESFYTRLQWIFAKNSRENWIFNKLNLRMSKNSLNLLRMSKYLKAFYSKNQNLNEFLLKSEVFAIRNMKN